MSLRTVNVTCYVTPLRAGGSLPAIAEADDGFLIRINMQVLQNIGLKQELYDLGIT
jgi:hypothetical protein